MVPKPGPCRQRFWGKLLSAQEASDRSKHGALHRFAVAGCDQIAVEKIGLSGKEVVRGGRRSDMVGAAAFLNPHIVLISVAREHLTKLGPIDWKTLPKTFTSKRNGDPRTPYVLQHAVTQFSPEQDTDVVFGPGAQVPFGTLSNEQKRGIVEIVMGHLNRAIENDWEGNRHDQTLRGNCEARTSNSKKT